MTHHLRSHQISCRSGKCNGVYVNGPSPTPLLPIFPQATICTSFPELQGAASNLQIIPAAIVAPSLATGSCHHQTMFTCNIIYNNYYYNVTLRQLTRLASALSDCLYRLWQLINIVSVFHCIANTISVCGAQALRHRWRMMWSASGCQALPRGQRHPCRRQPRSRMQPSWTGWDAVRALMAS